MKTSKTTWWKTILVLAGLALLWQAIAILTNNSTSTYVSDLVPTWQKIIFEEYPSLAAFQAGNIGTEQADYWVATKVLLHNAWVTVSRVLQGFLFGGSLGVVCGLIIGLAPTVRKMLYPVIRVLRNIPTLILISLFLIWFGGKELGIIIFISFSLWTIYCTSTIEAVATINPAPINFARTLGAGSMTIYTEVMVPMVIPNIIDASRISTGVCWAIALGGEYLVAQEGLGFILLMSQRYIMVGRMVVVLLCFMALSALMSGLISMLSKRAYRWMP